VYKTAFANYQKSKNILVLKNFYNLMKPRVMSLVVFTAFVGLIISNKQVDFVTSALALFFVALGAGAAGALNMWYDSEIDAVMSRTCLRPIPLGKISNTQALYFGISLSLISIVGLYLVSNILSASILAITIGFYIFIYTIWLKKRTPQNIVIGGAAGAFPPMIGWAAIAGSLSIEILLIFTIIFVWTPPHFWALALYKSDDYRRANIPMMPLIVGNKRTVDLIIVYSLILMPVVMSLSFYYSMFYSVSIFTLSSIFVYLSITLKLGLNKPGFEKKAQNLFFFSIFYLFNIFSIILIDNTIW
jgi:protoheme IX farnesyltransferase